MPLRQFLADCSALGDRRGPLLVQLPPSLAFDRRVARTFFDLLRREHGGPVACEPRHPTWFSAVADALLVDYRVARVAADPACVPAAAIPGGWPGLVYYRLHGSPRTYWSAYEDDALDRIAADVRAFHGRRDDADVWCIFDNTAGGAAAGNALAVLAKLR